MILSLRGETFNKAQARECLEVADAVYELGWISDDAKRFQSSIREYRRALEFANLAKAALPQAELGLGKALRASGDTGAAVTCLSGLIQRDAEQAPAEARFHLGLAYAKSGDPAAAARTLGEWLSRNPQHADAGWVGVYIDWLNRVRGGTPAGRKRALLIGINRYTMNVAELRGCVNDAARLMRPLLARWGFQEEDVVLLADEEATAGRVRAELDKLRISCRPEDAVLIHFSGHAVPSSEPNAFGPNDRENVYLLLHDTHNRQGFLENGVSADELHQRLQAIPALRKMIVLDTHASQPLVDLAEREGTYALILASDTAEIAYEWSVEVAGEKLACGMLTGALYQAGMDLPPEDFTYDHWIAPAIRTSQEASSNAALYLKRQTPLFVGQREGSVLGGEDFLLPLFEFSLRRQWPEMTASQLMKHYRMVRQSLSLPHAQAHLAFGRALLSKGEYGAAVEALKTAAAQIGREDRAVLLPLLRAHLGAGDLAQAIEACRRLADCAATSDQAAFASLLAQMEAMAGSRRHAVLVGIDRYRSRKLPSLKGAVNDAKAMHKVLVDRWGFAGKDVTLLCDKSANRETIVSEFKRIAQVSQHETAVFYFAGLGSADPERLPTIVSHDGRSKGVEDIAVKELAELAGHGAANLIVILDAGIGFGPLWSTEERSIRPDERSTGKTSSFPNDEDRRRFLKELKIGAFSILHAPERW
jgi:tetratricopeptide (TPR) repeat protein